MRVWVFLGALLICPLDTWAKSQISTYLEGSVIRRSAKQIVLVTDEGTYWIDTNRPVSHTRKLSQGQIGFWIQVKQIKRFREIVRVEDERFPSSRIADHKSLRQKPGG